jgi:hypothetical protein
MNQDQVGGKSEDGITQNSDCPGCGTISERIHSRYQGRVADLPLAGRPIRIVVVAASNIAYLGVNH